MVVNTKKCVVDYVTNISNIKKCVVDYVTNISNIKNCVEDSIPTISLSQSTGQDVGLCHNISIKILIFKIQKILKTSCAPKLI